MIVMASTISLHNINVPDFLKVLDQCTGNVFLVTDEEASVICENSEDESKLFRFNLYRDTGDAK